MASHVIKRIVLLASFLGVATMANATAEEPKIAPSVVPEAPPKKPYTHWLVYETWLPKEGKYGEPYKLEGYQVPSGKWEVRTSKHKTYTFDSREASPNDRISTPDGKVLILVKWKRGGTGGESRLLFTTPAPEGTPPATAEPRATPKGKPVKK